MTKGLPFPVDPVLTGIVMNYHNADMIADKVFPRLEPRLGNMLFKWMKFDFAQGITVPDTKVGRKSAPNEVEFAATEQTASCEDYGLDDVIPNLDISNAPQGYDPEQAAALYLMDLIELDREVRAAAIAFNAANYAATNKTTLAGTSQWSHASSDPIADIGAAADAMVMRPNKLTLGQAGWSALRRNPNVLKAITQSGTDKGMARREAVADLLELDEIIVGAAWVNSAKPGQAAVRVRTWGKHALLTRHEPIATSARQMPTYGWTAQYGERVSGSIDEPKIGLRGSRRVRSGESVKEVLSAPDLGYFFENVAA